VACHLLVAGACMGGVAPQRRASCLLTLWSSPIPGADIRSVCTEAGMFAIRARRKVS
jgi:hypothetical protein